MAPGYHGREHKSRGQKAHCPEEPHTFDDNGSDHATTAAHSGGRKQAGDCVTQATRAEWARKHGAPSLLLMRITFVLTGLGTAMLGPILPLLAHQWHLRDEQSGLLLMAQFCGSFLGGATMSWRLRRGLLLGMTSAAVGLMAFALAQGLAMACVGLFVGGFGIGHSITSINILASQRFLDRRASALALLNFFWSFGAMLAPLLAAAFASRFRLAGVLESFAGAFAVCAVAVAFEMRRGFGDVRIEGDVAQARGLGRQALLFFTAMLFLYGGLETCLSGWLTTYTLRYGDHRLAISEYTTLLFWMSLTIGRAASSFLLLLFAELRVWRTGLALTVLLTLALAISHGTAAIAASTVFLGLCLAPWFPVAFSLLMTERPRSRQAGVVISVSGLGAAALPWLMGVISTRGGGLQIALVVPLLAGAVLLSMSFAARVSGRAQTGAAGITA